MSDLKTIKEIDDETWNEFKGLAKKHQQKLGPFFKTMLRTYQQSESGWWERMLKPRTILTPKQAKEIKEDIKAWRKEYGWRD